MLTFPCRTIGVFSVVSAVALFAAGAFAGVEKLGPEFQINTYTEDDQGYPTVAPTQDGGFVVVWQSYEQDFSYSGVFGQRYDKDGNPVGNEFQVNTTTYQDQYNAAVTSDAKGNFVVVWQSYDQDGDEFGVFEMGSTVVLIFERADLVPVGSLGRPIAMGEPALSLGVEG